MPETLTVSSRGQITLPAALRKRFGIQAGGVLIAEEGQGNIILRPAVVIEVDTYSDQDISAWDAEDHLPAKEREAILKRFRNKP